MGKVQYVPNRREVRGLLFDDRVRGLVQEHGDRLSGAAGDGFEVSYRQGRSRYRGIVYADSWSAKHRDRRENILVRVLG